MVDANTNLLTETDEVKVEQLNARDTALSEPNAGNAKVAESLVPRMQYSEALPAAA